jgi:hypothetical protein
LEAETEIEVVLLAGEPGSVVLGVAVVVVDVSSVEAEDGTYVNADVEAGATEIGTGTSFSASASSSDSGTGVSSSGSDAVSAIGEGGGVLMSKAALTI